MKKYMKKWGEGFGIYFTKEEASLYWIQEGDIIEIPEDVLKKVMMDKETYDKFLDCVDMVEEEKKIDEKGDKYKDD